MQCGHHAGFSNVEPGSVEPLGSTRLNRSGSGMCVGGDGLTVSVPGHGASRAG
jgi:hypothetical protein